jgi:hypothetical protein
MIYASIIYRSYKNNVLFKEGAGENNGEFFLPYQKLRQEFLRNGVELNTEDVNSGKKVAFELYINCCRQTPKARAYVYLYENPLIRLINRNRRMLDRYAKWFTWDGDLLDDDRAVRLFYPNQLEPADHKGPQERPLFLVLVTTNNAIKDYDPREQFGARVEIIKWYERHAPNDFHLFGRGWDCPAALSGRWGQICNQARKIIARVFPVKSPFATWRGPVASKSELLTRTRFSLAYENSRDLPGYITEKLFDCFRSGCVPVYIGPKEIHDYVPADCFIDGRKFPTTAALHSHLLTIDDAAYRGYQERIRAYLRSEQAHPFSQDHFAEVIVREILADLASQAN